ncbi:single-stranded DNA-binding protein [Cytobacillus kochii]|uniref:single-stranded DNA-binding protein n=1 Tax=Cytobacillus kochii TaxID=859143 RepID=UPI0021E5A41D|nr:single-stranded DNA-binding protein [Cytobacillus kochii]
MNVITLTGNSVKDIDLKYTPNGKAVGNGTIAVRRDFKNQNGEYETDFINFVALGGAAEVMANHISKGDKFGITGRLQIRRWEKDGKTNYFTEVIVNSFDFPSKNTKGQNQQQRQTNNNSYDNYGSIDISDDSLPF